MDAGRYLAQRWGLEYREAHTLSIDPNALTIIDGSESRRLAALPLQLSADGPVFAVAEPSEERFAAVRALAGDNATFVVVAQETLDALLNSKVFSVGAAAVRPVEAVSYETETTEPPAEAESHEHHSESQESESHQSDSRQGEFAEGAEGGAPVTDSHSELELAAAAVSNEALDTLLTQIATGTGNLRSQVGSLTESLEANQRELREAKEQLAEANRASEGHTEIVNGLRAEIESLKDELARSRALNDATTARLRDVVRALEPLTFNEEDASAGTDPAEVDDAANAESHVA